MPLDPLAKRLLTMMAAAAPQTPSRPSVEARRQSLAKLMQFARAEAPDVTTSDGTLPGPGGKLPYRLYTPASADERAPGFVFFHGGGLVAGSILTHDRIAAALAHVTRCRLVSVDYRLAPDLDRHVARANQSAINFGLKPVVDAGTWLTLANEGIARFAANPGAGFRGDLALARGVRRRSFDRLRHDRGRSRRLPA